MHFNTSSSPITRQLRAHCYRMLGSFHDAEDMVQETFLRAWRGLFGFDGRAPILNWLYRIATNACLNALAARARASRVLPETQSPPTEQMPEREPSYEVPWLEPYPDSALEGIPDRAPGPDVRYELQESVQLAFIAAIQLLPPRQRAVLLLRDVRGLVGRRERAIARFIRTSSQQRAAASPRNPRRTNSGRTAASHCGAKR